MPRVLVSFLSKSEPTVQSVTIIPLRGREGIAVKNPIKSSFTYDAVAILGFGEASTEPLPEPAPGEIIIRVGDWSLQDLRDSKIGNELMHQQDWYDKYDLAMTEGIYRVRLPVPDSNRKNLTEQKGLLLSDEEVAPVALGASALLVHLKEIGNDLLKNNWCRCEEALPDDSHVELFVRDGRVGVLNRWDGFRNGNLWLSAARKF